MLITDVTQKPFFAVSAHLYQRRPDVNVGATLTKPASQAKQAMGAEDVAANIS